MIFPAVSKCFIGVTLLVNAFPSHAKLHQPVSVSAVEDRTHQSNFLSSLKSQIDVKSRTLFDHASAARRVSETDGEDGTLCDWVDTAFGSDFVEGNGQGSCSCSGSFNGTIVLGCKFDNVCDEVDNVCGSMKFEATLSGFWNDGEGFGENPTLTINACSNVTTTELEEICITLDYATPDFITAKSCDLTYGGKDCVCTINENDACIDWDCSAVAPASLADVLQSQDCKNVSWTGDDGNTTGTTVSSFLLVQDVPEGTASTESTTPSRAKSTKGYPDLLVVASLGFAFIAGSLLI